MHIAILTNEYPPHIYGGAGVHVEYLTRELAQLDQGAHSIEVLCFGDQVVNNGNVTVRGLKAPTEISAQDPRHTRLMDTLLLDLLMAGAVKKPDIVHCHTWYAHFGGCLVKQLTGAKLVLTTHSLEPHRPWKVEQLGSAYHVSSWIEKTAYHNADGVVAVSASMSDDVHQLYGVPRERIRVIHNGIDLAEYRPESNPAILQKYGIDPDRPYVLFVGRITRQKGIIHLVSALRHVRPGVQIVLCAGAPDTKDIGEEMSHKVTEVRQATPNPIIWIAQMLPRDEVISIYAGAAIFVCPSVYEPFGIINLEAMACGTPVVASAVGGIKEVVVHGETGLLIPLEARGPTDFEPRDPARFAEDLARGINTVLEDSALRKSMGQKSRERVEQHFSWTSIALRTCDFYQELLQPAR